MRPFTASVLLLLASGCGAPPPTEPAGAERAPLRVQGSDTLMVRLVPALAETYRQTSTTAVFETKVTPTDEAVRNLFDREADIVASGRPARPSEEEQAKVLGFSLDSEQSKHIIGVDVVSVAVHPSRALTSLTYDQVIGVFCTREITDWSELGQPAHPIRAVVPDLEQVATRGLFEDFFCGPKGIHAKIDVGAPDAIRTALAEDPDVISFVSASEGVGKALALSPDPDLPPVAPSQDNIIRGAYPLYGDVYLLTRGTPTGDAAAFLKWIESPAGQEVVDEQRFVPLFLRPERLDEPRPLRETISFEPGSSTPDARSMARLNLLVDEVRERGVRHVILEGYTDGSEADPFALAEQRAVAVKTLLEADVEGLYFEVIPRGPKNPIAPNNTPYGRQVNRRVQVYLAEDERESAATDAATTGGE